jgi:hypothetical protein
MKIAFNVLAGLILGLLIVLNVQLVSLHKDTVELNDHIQYLDRILGENL